MAKVLARPKARTGHYEPSLLLRRVLDRYVRAFAPERIVLFGSCAKGTSDIGSDIDLLVVAEIIGARSFHLRRAHQLAADCFPRVDTVFATPEEVAAANTARSPFLASILEAGIVLYSRPSLGMNTEVRTDA
jgi:predicted nucleotidyltransferase